MKKRIVLALGGNALGNNIREQMIAVRNTAITIADLIYEGYEVIITHGNGPQVGAINIAMGELHRLYPDDPKIPLSTCVAMSQGYIGCDFQNALREELLNRGINKEVSTIITNVCVDENDEAFMNPTKPIGKFLDKKEAEELIANGEKIMSDSGRGYRRIVASPKPIDIVEIESIKTLLNAGHVVIAGGGGGIPVIKQGNHLKRVEAVIDKDFVSAKMAELLNADCLVILTAVEKVAINFGKPNIRWLDTLSVEDAQRYIVEGQFAKGSMLPKVQAAIQFASIDKSKASLITLLEKAKEGIKGKTGTLIRA